LGTLQIACYVVIGAVLKEVRSHRVMLIRRQLSQKLPDDLSTSLGVYKSLDALKGIVGQDQRFSLEMLSSAFLYPAAPAARGELVVGNGIEPRDRRCFPGLEPSQ
jgi:hypothetical protein